MSLRPTQTDENCFNSFSRSFQTVSRLFQTELSSRPERTRISCHAVLDEAVCALP
jgi:hypothetical protein